MRDISDHVSCLITFSSENRAVYQIIKKCYIDGEATDDNVTHSEYAILTAFFHGNNGYMHFLQCYVIRTLPVLFRYFLSVYFPYTTLPSDNK